MKEWECHCSRQYRITDWRGGEIESVTEQRPSFSPGLKSLRRLTLEEWDVLSEWPHRGQAPSCCSCHRIIALRAATLHPFLF